MEREKLMKFEEAIKRLEEIVRILEKGEVSLDDSLSLFEEGVQLRKFCSKRLSEVERKIRMITEEGDVIDVDRGEEKED
ncbi:MAG: exodeoxyribonuclease VII small subunit [bacterium]|nr:exodeoxyribonuclease VII small subunit [bacterium]